MTPESLLPGNSSKQFLTWTGLETDLIFNHGIDLPGFASFPLLEHAGHRKLLQNAARDQLAIARAYGFATIWETVTWMANTDRAVDLGYDAAALDAANKDAVDMLVDLRDALSARDVVISANIGPRSDAYRPDTVMTPQQAEAYHSTQIDSLADTAADLISGYTFSNSAEAIGVINAARARDLPVIIAFTVETDGRLPNGEPLDTAIATTDDATHGAAAYFMINCAHPDHFETILTDNPRLGGVAVNASRCSHAELDEAEELDDGDPVELAQDVARLIRKCPSIKVIGGCCGTDMRHLTQMAKAARTLS